MKTKEYNEEDALKGYVWQNYPEIVRHRDCMPSPEMIRQQLPLEFQDEYWEYRLECRRIIVESASEDERLAKAGRVQETTPMLPEMRPELLAVVWPVFRELENKAFWEKFKPHQSVVSIARCGRCKKILVNDMSRQCLWCGHDWHDKTEGLTRR
jgi:hypothetical protein